jgi:cobalt-zinc-cadmium efflux system membrane fusion protein
MSLQNPMTLIALALVALGIGLAGCSQAPPSAPPAAQTAGAGHSHGHSHDGWWCDEHGVPEEVCALCNSKVAADFQAKGDWCKEHDRPDSQCFICHPEKEAEFAAQYEAKYGKQPPKPEGS